MDENTIKNDLINKLRQWWEKQTDKTQETIEKNFNENKMIIDNYVISLRTVGERVFLVAEKKTRFSFLGSKKEIILIDFGQPDNMKEAYNMFIEKLNFNGGKRKSHRKRNSKKLRKSKIKRKTIRRR
jgi:hypothetical protein